MQFVLAGYWDPPLEAAPYLQKFIPDEIEPSLIGFDQVYMINLKRRQDRFVKMDNAMKILGIEYEYREAVDGL